MVRIVRPLYSPSNIDAVQGANTVLANGANDVARLEHRHFYYDLPMYENFLNINANILRYF